MTCFAIPTFVFAGNLMEKCGMSYALVNLARVLVGWVRGGLGMSVVLAEYFFSGISGSTIADVSAIGAMLTPPMLRAGYKPEHAVSLVASATAMGILVPPAIFMIVLGQITDTSVVNRVTVRVDSTPFGALFVEGFWRHPPKDTLYGFFGQAISSFATVFNPVQATIAVGGSPYAAAVNPVTNRIYVTNPGATGVTVLDGGTDTILDTVNVGGPTSAAAVSPETNRLYVSQDTITGSRLWAFDGVSHTPVKSIGLGVRTWSIAVDSARNRIYVAANVCDYPPAVTLVCDPVLGLLLMALDGDSLGVIDTVRSVSQGRGAAYNPVTDRIYVAVSSGLFATIDTVKVIDAATFQVIDSIQVGAGAFGVAVNPVTNRIYVTNETDGTISVIDGATNAVVTTVFMGSNTFPEGIGVDPVRNLVYVSHAGVGVMRIIDGAIDVDVGQIDVGGPSTDAQPNPVTGRFYVPVMVQQAGQVRALRYQ